MAEKRDGSIERKGIGLSGTTQPSIAIGDAEGSRERGGLPLKVAFELGGLLDGIRPQPATELRLSVRRPDDLLVFDVLVDNLRVETGTEGPRLVRSPAGPPARLIVEFPPQSFGEQAFLQQSPKSVNGFDGSDSANKAALLPRNPPISQESLKKRFEPEVTKSLPPLPASCIRMSGPSRLAFLMPENIDELPLSLDTVLEAMRVWPLSLDANARAHELPPIDAQYLDYLGLDLRYGLVAGRPREEQARLLEALNVSTRRISTLGAGALGLREPRELSRTLLTALHEESAGLFKRFPALAEGYLLEATLATLVLGSAANLQRAAERAGMEGGEFYARFPYLPLWLGLPHAPARNVTALELPYRLVLSPVDKAHWDHRTAPFAPRGRTELWHTRLVEPPLDGPSAKPPMVRAIWSPDYPEQNIKSLVDPPRPFRMSLDVQDRQFLVRLMADYQQFRADHPRRPYTPVPARAKRLHLSSLGALVDLEGDWDPRPQDVDLEQWRHLATLGRDHYVRVVYPGKLVCLQHAASLVKVTERTFESLEDGNPNTRIAVLRQRFYIVVRERVRTYTGERHKFEGRNFPFKEVEILTRVTPDLQPPEQCPLEPVTGIYSEKIFDTVVTSRMVFWPRTEKGEFRFEILATDLAGKRQRFSMPLLFVSEVVNASDTVITKAKLPSPPAGEDKNASDTVIKKVSSAYNDKSNRARRQGDLTGAGVSYAVFDGKPVEPLPTKLLTFFADVVTSPSTVEANFYPTVELTKCNVPAFQKLLGRNDAIEMTYPEAIKQGLPNAGQIYLRVDKTPHSLTFGGGGKTQSDTLGALASPQMEILGLSNRSGPVAGDIGSGTIEDALKKNVLANKFAPRHFLPAEAKILGGISLRDILIKVVDLDAGEAPRFLTTDLGNAVEAKFAWTTPITQSDPKNLIIPTSGGATTLTMTGRTVTPFDPTAAITREASAELTNFKLNLFGFIILWVDRIKFDQRPGQKPDVTVQMHAKDAVMFGGPLEFVNDLREFIPSNGFSDTPSLAVTPSGIAASYSLSLPTIGVGIFSLSNVSLGAGFNLPFDARPASVRFNFAERQRPFSLTVSLLGGGGFFAIGISAKGVEEIEAAIEFGAALVIDLGVASGGVEIKAGVYFHWKETTGTKIVELTGYVRIHGELTVLCLISASLTFNLQLGYLKQSNQSMVFGEALLVVEIEILFFSFDVSVRCRREFAGGAADPRFIDLVPDEDVWSEYCMAFAKEGI